MEKQSKLGQELQNSGCSLTVELLSPLALSPVSYKISKYSHILTLKWCLDDFALVSYCSMCFALSVYEKKC